MRVLIASEESQVVCSEFRKLGHEAYSCDTQRCSGKHPEWHIKDDLLLHLNKGWDLIIAFTPCTRQCNSGRRWLVGAPPDGMTHLQVMMEFATYENLFRAVGEADCPKICRENPIPHDIARAFMGEYTQLIQPWMFGHAETKATCLWLKNLPPLQATSALGNDMFLESLELPDDPAERNRIHWMAKSEERSKLRSKTYPGIAKAMAEQWGGDIND